MRRFVLYAPAGEGGGGVALTPAEVQRMTEALSTATTQLNETRLQMNEQQKKIGELITKQTEHEKANTTQSAEAKAVKDQLASLAMNVENLAQQNTNLLEITRKQSRAISQSSANGQVEGGFSARHVGAKGTLFQSRRQAVELGYFFMATMSRKGPARQYANNWLKQNANNLSYLPNYPKSLIQDLGDKHLDVMKKCYAQGLEYGAEALAGNVTPGSILVSPSFADTFIRNVEEYGVFRQEATVWPMGSDVVYVPRRIGGLTFYWVNEAGAATASDPNFDMLTMTAKKGMMFHQFSSELAEDENAAISLADLIMFEFALAEALEEDRIGFNGDGSGGNSPGYAGFWGVLGNTTQAYAAEASEDKNATIKYTAGTGLDRTDEVTLKGLRGVIGLCHTWAKNNAKWYMHRTVAQDLYGIETTGGGPITSSDQSDRKRLLGYPIREVEVMPASPGTATTNVFAFGDLRKSWMLGDRRNLEIETSEHYNFNTDQIAMRATTRLAFLPVSPTGMVVYLTAA